MKSCELCKSAAKVYCDSDQASLCWTCDNKVHSANFLVARHSRALLCRKCHSTTPWTASGEKLGPSAVSICEKCVVDTTAYKEEEEEDDDDDEYDVDEDSENEIDVDDEDNDNQVVPLSFTPPPPASSSSCCDYSGGDSVLVKRKRENVADLCSEDDCLSVQKHQHVVSVESSEGNRGTIYNFLPLSSEAMGEKAKMMSRKNENKTGSVVGGCKGTRGVVSSCRWKGGCLN